MLFSRPERRPGFSFSAGGQFKRTGTLQKIHDVKEPTPAAVMTRALPLRRYRGPECDRISKINFSRAAGAEVSERSLTGPPRRKPPPLTFRRSLAERQRIVDDVENVALLDEAADQIGMRTFGVDGDILAAMRL